LGQLNAANGQYGQTLTKAIILLSERWLPRATLGSFSFADTYSSLNMKRLITIILVALAPVALFAQKNIIKLDIHSPIMRTGQMTYERVISENASFGMSLLYMDRSEGIGNADYLTRFAVTPEFRYYLMDFPAPRGLFVSGNLRYQWMKAEWQEIYYLFDGPTTLEQSSVFAKELSTFGIGVNVGIQEVYKERISIEVFAGPCWNSGDQRAALGSSGNLKPNEPFQPYVGYFLRTGINVGIAF